MARNLKTTGFNLDTGAAPKIDGVGGDIARITGQFATIAVDTSGNPLNSTTSAGGTSYIPLDPFAFGSELITQTSQYSGYCILGLELWRELTNGQDNSLSKGRLSLALNLDPAYPLYETPTYANNLNQTMSNDWPLNPNETVTEAGLKLRYTCKERKIFFVQHQTDTTTTSESDLRQGYQMAFTASQIGAFTPSTTGATVAVGYINYSLIIGLYNRTPVLSPATLGKMVAAHARGFAYQYVCDGRIQPPKGGLWPVLTRKFKSNEFGGTSSYRWGAAKHATPLSAQQRVLTAIVMSACDTIGVPVSDIANALLDRLGVVESDGDSDSDDDIDTKGMETKKPTSSPSTSAAVPPSAASATPVAADVKSGVVAEKKVVPPDSSQNDFSGVDMERVQALVKSVCSPAMFSEIFPDRPNVSAAQRAAAAPEASTSAPPEQSRVASVDEKTRPYFASGALSAPYRFPVPTTSRRVAIGPSSVASTPQASSAPSVTQPFQASQSPSPAERR